MRRDGYAVFGGSTFAHVTGVRLRGAAEVEAAVADVRELVAARRLGSVTWWVGDAATPPDVCARLEALGLVLRERVAALALDRPPQGTPPFEARPARSAEEFLAAQEVDWEQTGVGAASRERLRRDVAAAFARDGEYGRTFLVEDGGEVIAIGRCRYGPEAVFLTGGATAPHARGRGAYTSLVHARWRDAVARGTPRLATQATAMSAPILRRLGFVDVGTVALYVDRI